MGSVCNQGDSSQNNVDDTEREGMGGPDKLKREIEDLIKANKVVLISKSWSVDCRKVGLAMGKHGVMNMHVVEADHRPDEQKFMNALEEVTGKKWVPQVFIASKFISDDIVALDEKGQLHKMLETAGALDTEPASPNSSYDYDLFVLGGGSGGCAAALEAGQQQGVRVAVADCVKPSAHGTTWGVGGTCVNVGCIPKKLMHIGATLGENMHDLASFGWKSTADGGKVELKHNWDTMCTGIRSYIKDLLNQGMLDGFEANHVAYFNSYATLKDRHTLELDNGEGEKKTVTSKYILLAAGGRPNDGGYPGAAEHCITSDDLFWLKEPPGKTLVVGAAYIALECAGFLTGLGYDTTVMVRSMLLRGFDRECVDKIDAYMVKAGTKFIRGTVPTRFEKGTERKVKVFWRGGTSGGEVSQEFDTVLLAVGRRGEAEKLGLGSVGVAINDGKVKAPCEQTNIPNIFAIGDLVADRLELTPVAKVAGKKVVRRLFGNDLQAMDYTMIATTVFTPLEYGMVGLSEEQAKEKHGDALEVVRKDTKPLEWAVSEHRHPDCFFKVLIDTKDEGRIVGFHILGPGAGEIMQGLALAIKMGATKAQLDDVIGIHPTLAETMTMMSGKKIEGVVCES